MLTKREFRYYQNRELFEKDHAAHRVITLDKINKAFLTVINCKHRDMNFFIIQMKYSNNETTIESVKKESKDKVDGSDNIGSYFPKSNHIINNIY